MARGPRHANEIPSGTLRNDQKTPPVFDRRTPNCERGYIGCWKISNGVLWLIGLHAWRDGKFTGVADLFSGRRAVVAEWFTGPLVVEPTALEISGGAVPKMRTLLVEAGCVIQGGAKLYRSPSFLRILPQPLQVGDPEIGEYNERTNDADTS